MKKLFLFLLVTSAINGYGQIKIKFDNRTDSAITVNIQYGEITSPTESFVLAYTSTILPRTVSSDFIRIAEVKKHKKFLVIGTIPKIGNFKYFES